MPEATSSSGWRTASASVPAFRFVLVVLAVVPQVDELPAVRIPAFVRERGIGAPATRARPRVLAWHRPAGPAEGARTAASLGCHLALKGPIQPPRSAATARVAASTKESRASRAS